MQDSAQNRSGGGFLAGLAAGAVFTALFGSALVYVADANGLIELRGTLLPGPQQLVDWSQRNLGSAAVWFALLMVLFTANLLGLRRRLRRGAEIESVAQAEHFSDIWASLFFGVGVIYTAIGMRAALIHALGDPASVAADGAFAILQRMVDGGILLALSTTIVGGIGGYLMRLIKTLVVGSALKRFYEGEHRAPGERIEARLASIEMRLGKLADAQGSRSRSRNDSAVAV